MTPSEGVAINLQRNAPHIQHGLAEDSTDGV